MFCVCLCVCVFVDVCVCMQRCLFYNIVPVFTSLCPMRHLHEQWTITPPQVPQPNASCVTKACRKATKACFFPRLTNTKACLLLHSTTTRATPEVILRRGITKCSHVFEGVEIGGALAQRCSCTLLLVHVQRNAGSLNASPRTCILQDLITGVTFEKNFLLTNTPF